MSLPTTLEERARFIELYIEHKFNFSAAARAVGRNPKTMRYWLKNDPVFREAFEDARATMADEILAEMYRRAVHGVEEEVFGSLGGGAGTGVVGTVQKYSDTLLLQMARGLVPEMREKSTLELTGAGGGPVEISDTTLAMKLASIIAVARERQKRGEIVDVEIVEPKVLPPPPDNSDLL